jgi:hypothetical protein
LYRTAHDRSQLLREQLQETTRHLQSDPAAAARPHPALHEVVRRIRQDYFNIRIDLFTTTYAHAAALVETHSSRPFPTVLEETMLTLASAADLVMNAEAAMTLLTSHTAMTALWNESAGISSDHASQMVASDLHVHLHDLFRSGLPTLERHRPDLEQAYAQRTSLIHELMPDGVDASMAQITGAYRTLRTRVVTQDLAEDQVALRTLVARSKEERIGWHDALIAIQERLVRDKGVVRGDIHLRLAQMKRSFLDLRESLYPLAFKHVGILTREDLAYPPDLRLRAVGLSSLAAGTLYENAALFRKMADTIPVMKELLNQADPAQGIPKRLWDHVEHEYAYPEHRQLFKAGLSILGSHQAEADQPDPFLDYVMTELGAMASVAQLRDEPLVTRYARVLKHYESRSLATGVSVLGQGKIQTSKGFGNFVGAFEFRKGKLYDQPQWIEFVKTRVQPGDILLEKTPFRVTDKFIPGHFGHVALYVGTEAQLKELGLLDHPAVAPYHARLREGRTVVEALREGTQINTVEHFLNIDDIAILRPKPDHIPKGDILQAIMLAFTHIGKQYDFGFDTNTWDTIVCSELAFQTYVNVRWPFGRTLGSYTISPDDVAIMAGLDQSQPFQLVSFVNDAQVVSDLANDIAGERYYRRLIGPKGSSQAGLFQFFPSPSPALNPFQGKDKN